MSPPCLALVARVVTARILLLCIYALLPCELSEVAPVRVVYDFLFLWPASFGCIRTVRLASSSDFLRWSRVLGTWGYFQRIVTNQFSVFKWLYCWDISVTRLITHWGLWRSTFYRRDSTVHYVDGFPYIDPDIRKCTTSSHQDVTTSTHSERRTLLNAETILRSYRWWVQTKCHARRVPGLLEARYKLEEF